MCCINGVQYYGFLPKTCEIKRILFFPGVRKTCLFDERRKLNRNKIYYYDLDRNTIINHTHTHIHIFMRTCVCV